MYSFYPRFFIILCCSFYTVKFAKENIVAVNPDSNKVKTNIIAPSINKKLAANTNTMEVAEKTTPSSGNVSLEKALTADGFIKRGIEGSFNATGFRMAFTPSGEPYFLACQQWDNRFSVGITGLYVYAIAVVDSNVYVGGEFRTVGGINTGCLAVWNGRKWSKVGAGTMTSSSRIYALAIRGNLLYVGGSFQYTESSFTVNNIATFNGTNWAKIGAGIVGTVRCLSIQADTIYAGGRLYTSGSTTLNNMAKWDGTNWLALGSGTNNDVLDMAVKGTDVYAAGYFTTAGGQPANFIAKWNGNSWQALGGGMTIGVTDIALSATGDTLFAGGGSNLRLAGSNSKAGLAAWINNAWQSLDTTVYSIRDLKYHNNKLYVSAAFITATDTVVAVRTWDGNSWQQVGSSFAAVASGPFFAMAFKDSTIYGGGPFWGVGDKNARDIAIFNGTDWHPWGTDNPREASGLYTENNAGVRVVAIKGNKVYVGGEFTTTNGISNFAVWDGLAWSSMGAFSGPVRAICFDNNKMYVGGAFGYINGQSVSANIVMWDGTRWQSLGSGLIDGGSPGEVDGNVSAIAVMNGKVYAGGSFLVVRGSTEMTRAIAVWDGTRWANVRPAGSTATGLNSAVTSLVVANNKLYVGGGFSTYSQNLAVWNDTVWAPVSFQTPNAVVYSLVYDSGYLYVGGYFTKIGTITYNHIARWNGTNWSGLGNGIASPVYAMAASTDHHIVAVSQHTNPDNTNCNMAIWNGASWSCIGNGTDGDIRSVAIQGGNVYIGGSFSAADGTTSANIAMYNDCSLIEGYAGEYVFTGSGNWSDPVNWEGGKVPPQNITNGMNVIIRGAICTVAGDITVFRGGNFSVDPASAFTISGSVVIM